MQDQTKKIESEYKWLRRFYPYLTDKRARHKLRALERQITSLSDGREKKALTKILLELSFNIALQNQHLPADVMGAFHRYVEARVSSPIVECVNRVQLASYLSRKLEVRAALDVLTGARTAFRRIKDRDERQKYEAMISLIKKAIEEIHAD